MLTYKRGWWSRVCKRALAFVTAPLGATTLTWGVISRTVEGIFVRDVWVLTLLVVVPLGLDFLASMWSTVWCGLSHSVHIEVAGHPFAICPFRKQFMHNHCSFTKAILSSWDNWRNFLHAYNWCFASHKVQPSFSAVVYDSSVGFGTCIFVCWVGYRFSRHRRMLRKLGRANLKILTGPEGRELASFLACAVPTRTVFLGQAWVR